MSNLKNKQMLSQTKEELVNTFSTVEDSMNAVKEIKVVLFELLVKCKDEQAVNEIYKSLDRYNDILEQLKEK